MVPTETPATEIEEIMFMAFLDFFANRYLRDMYRDRFIGFSNKTISLQLQGVLFPPYGLTMYRYNSVVAQKALPAGNIPAE